MGLIFNRKAPSGSTINKNFVASKQLGKKEIRGIAHDSGIVGKSGQYFLEKGLTKARYGSLKKGAVGDLLKKGVEGGYISAASVGKVAKNLGLSARDAMQFQNSSKQTQPEKSSPSRGVTNFFAKPASGLPIDRQLPKKADVKPADAKPQSSALERLQLKSFEDPSVGLAKKTPTRQAMNIWD